MSPMLAIAPCFGCGETFGFNPDRVPSIRSPDSGHREPICAACVVRANVLRKANGRDPIVVLPGAYDAADDDERDYGDNDRDREYDNSFPVERGQDGWR